VVPSGPAKMAPSPAGANMKKLITEWRVFCSMSLHLLLTHVGLLSRSTLIPEPPVTFGAIGLYLA
jgi:hypothetical protein